MSNKLKILAILLFMTYAVTVCYDLYHSGSIFIEGFKDGWSDARDRNESGEEGDDCAPVLFVKIPVVPKEGSLAFVDETQNLLSTNRVNYLINDISVKVKACEIPRYNLFIISSLFCALLVFGFCLEIPFLFFKIVRDVSRNKILDSRVIKRTSRLGFTLIIIASLSFISSVASYLAISNTIEIEKYSIVFRMESYVWYFVIGVIALFIAEILRMALRLKEEQDLTI